MAGGAGGAPPSTAWCGAGQGFPDDSPPPDRGLGTLSLIAGALGGPGRADGIGLAARFRSPQGIASDGAGKLYVADSENRLIRQVDIATRAVTTLAGSYYVRGSQGHCSMDGTGRAARFSKPADVVAGGDGKLYVSDIEAHVIRTIDIATGAVTTLAGTPDARGSTDGIGAAARFDGPSSLASDGAGHIYVVDKQNAATIGGLIIRQIDVATGAVATLAGAACSAVGAPVQFRKLTGLASAGAGLLYAVDEGFVYKIDLATGAVNTEFSWYTPPGEGSSTPIYGDLRSVALDGRGRMYVGTIMGLLQVNLVARTVTVATNLIALDLATDSAGNVYIVSAGAPSTDQIFRFAPTGGATAPFVGSTRNPSFADGSGADARFSSPLFVTTDGAGNIYVCDEGNHTIRMIAAGTNVVTTLAGTPGAARDNVDGIGAAARFFQLAAIVADEDGKHALHLGHERELHDPETDRRNQGGDDAGRRRRSARQRRWDRRRRPIQQPRQPRPRSARQPVRRR